MEPGTEGTGVSESGAVTAPSRVVVRVVDVYPYRMGEGGAPWFLLLHRADGMPYAGSWRMVGGKIEAGETAWQAGLRETEEELGVRPARFWMLPSVNLFYDWKHDRVQPVPAFAAEVAADPTLNDEHDAFVWLDANEAVRRLLWSEQRRLLALADQVLRSGGPLAEWVIA